MRAKRPSKRTLGKEDARVGGGDLESDSRVHCHVTRNDELVCLRELPEHNSTVASLSVAEVLAKLDQSLE